MLIKALLIMCTKENNVEGGSHYVGEGMWRLDEGSERNGNVARFLSSRDKEINNNFIIASRAYFL